MSVHKVLSIRQPWAELNISGVKDVESRVWATGHRGRLFIHASRKRDAAAIAQFHLDPAALTYGAVIGHVDLIDVVQSHPSPFFEGPHGWVLTNPQRIDPIPLRGRLRLFEMQAPWGASPPA